MPVRVRARVVGTQRVLGKAVGSHACAERSGGLRRGEARDGPVSVGLGRPGVSAWRGAAAWAGGRAREEAACAFPARSLQSRGPEGSLGPRRQRLRFLFCIFQALRPASFFCLPQFLLRPRGRVPPAACHLSDPLPGLPCRPRVAATPGKAGFRNPSASGSALVSRCFFFRVHGNRSEN